MIKDINRKHEIIQKTIQSLVRYKNLTIIGVSEIYNCVKNLEKLFDDLNGCLNVLTFDDVKTIDFENLECKINKAGDDLATIFKTYGTQNFEDFIDITLGSDFVLNNVNDSNRNVYNILKKHAHPINYKVMNWTKTSRGDDPDKKKIKIVKNRIVEDFMIVERSKNFDCFDLARTSKNFQTKVYGVKISLQCPERRRTLVVSAIIDDIIINCSNEPFIILKQKLLLDNHKSDANQPNFCYDDFVRFVKILTLKELLVYSDDELYKKYIGYMNQSVEIKRKNISQVVREFLNNELYGQRRTMIQLLMKNNNPEYQYLAYLLYDLLANDLNRVIDTSEQTIIYNSFPWEIKKFFKHAMDSTKKYTETLSNFDNSKIPIEQQICMMKASEKIKEKAMIKLKEVNAKSEDSGSKARQYLEGLLKIPFGIYRKEPVLKKKTQINKMFSELLINVKKLNHPSIVEYHAKLPTGDNFNSLEIFKTCQFIETTYLKKMNDISLETLINIYTMGKRSQLMNNVSLINQLIKNRKSIKDENQKVKAVKKDDTLQIKGDKICHSGKKNKYIKDALKNFIELNRDNDVLKNKLFENYQHVENLNHVKNTIKSIIDSISNEWSGINDYIENIENTLTDAVHGHDNAKKQISRIIGQWINGEQSGYCFGFEGPPGVGKTSLAKLGLSRCLENDDGEYRPFAFIAVGGSSNGSTLAGHNYTYVGSTWGRIVDILMETKCLNPIIYIDELDKVSRTEHGKEIIGILTHLVDSTQNEHFHDKYFNGVDIDLSKALFIFSYNDASNIDRILLDRIHRVKFDHLDLNDKQVITRKYLLPEILKKNGVENIIEISDEVVKFIIEYYTAEAGVRKLKEILYEIIGEINLMILKKKDEKLEIPIVVTEADIKDKYLKDRREIKYKKIHEKPLAGVICGLWANALGMGGIIPIETHFFPHNNFFELKLTGMQGDVMKESMNVAKTLAWSLTTKNTQKKVLANMKRDKMHGIHIHCPEGATPKDGPSAGTAITTAIYSLVNDLPIRNDIAITGEITLQGRVTAIGGLDLKILGGIRAGVTEFIFPKENDEDFQKFMKKYKEAPILEGIKFNQVEKIQDVFDILF